MHSFSKNLESKLQARYANRDSTRAAAVDRFDLKLWDHQAVGKHEARVLVGYSADLGVPRRSEIDQWVIKAFNGSVRTVLETIRPVDDQPLVTAHVVKIPEVRPFTHTAHMVRVATNAFMDDNDRVWDVRENNGSKYIVKVSKEDLDELLKKHEASTRTASVPGRPRLAKVANSSLYIEEGDEIAFTLNGIATTGRVAALLDDNTLRVRANNSSFVISPESVFDVKKVNAKSAAESEAARIDFYTKCYGDKGFATELVTGKQPKNQ